MNNDEFRELNQKFHRRFLSESIQFYHLRAKESSVTSRNGSSKYIPAIDIGEKIKIQCKKKLSYLSIRSSESYTYVTFYIFYLTLFCFIRRFQLFSDHSSIYSIYKGTKRLRQQKFPQHIQQY